MTMIPGTAATLGAGQVRGVDVSTTALSNKWGSSYHLMTAISNSTYLIMVRLGIMIWLGIIGRDNSTSSHLIGHWYG